MNASEVLVQAPLPDRIADWPDYFGDMAEGYDDLAFAGASLRRIADQEVSVVLGALSGRPVGALLDVGAGTARFSGPLASAGWNVTVFDGSPAMLEVIKRRVPQAERVLGLLGDPLPFTDARFDAVVAMRVVKYVHDTGAALTELARVVRPGGHVLVDLPNGRSLARLGYRRSTIGFVTPGSLPGLLEQAGLSAVSVHDGPRLPHPLLRFARSASGGRSTEVAERWLRALCGAQHGARSLIVEAVRTG